MPNIDAISEVCEECQLGKQHRESFPSKSTWKSYSPLELVHTDICGPIRVPSFGGSRYFLLFIDDLTKKVWVYFLKEKSEALPHLFEFKTQSEFFWDVK